MFYENYTCILSNAIAILTVEMVLVSVAAQWKSRESDSLVLIKNWLETPGWSTSWIAAAKMAARISRSVKTAFSWKERQNKGTVNTI